jgi:molecular chaperone GrpE
MTPKQDPKSEPDLSEEIERTMAEAEAAVSGSRDDAGDDHDAPAAGAAGGAGVDAELAATVVELENELGATKDRWLRAVAELENYKKRVKREMEESALRTTQTLLASFLPAIDNLERALEAAGSGSTLEQVVKGIHMVRDEFVGALKRHGIESVESVGKPFDPAVHDALQQIDSPDHPPGMVIREFERGYKMGDRLLRPARVIVAGAGSTGGGEGSGAGA